MEAKTKLGVKERFSLWRKNFFTAKNVAYFGVLTALEIVLLFFGMAIPVGTGGASLNFSLVPIILTAMLLGPVAGAVMGFISGLVISIMVVVGAQGAIFLFLFQEQPVMIILICLLKTTAAGGVSGLLYRLLKGKNQYVATFVSALAAPVVNTGIFILGCLCIGGAVELAAAEYGLGYSSAFAVIVLVFVSFNFFIEFAINLFLAPALHRIVLVTEKYIEKNRGKKRREKTGEIDKSEQAVQQIPSENTNTEESRE